MTCERVQMPGGGVAIVCSSRRRRPMCSCCGQRRATIQCDYPTPKRKSGTCDKHLCAQCAVSVGDDLDHCPSHPRGTPPTPMQGALQL